MGVYFGPEDSTTINTTTEGNVKATFTIALL